jgi:hypothetical protein
MRLDEEKLEALRGWGERLRAAGGEESGAVGRAILMLVEEIDRLHVDLWHARMEPSGEERVTTDETGEQQEQPVASSLHARVQRVLRRDAGTPPEPVEQSGPEREAEPQTSPQAWIAALRRQK